MKIIISYKNLKACFIFESFPHLNNDVPTAVHKSHTPVVLRNN